MTTKRDPVEQRAERWLLSDWTSWSWDDQVCDVAALIEAERRRAFREAAEVAKVVRSEWAHCPDGRQAVENVRIALLARARKRP